MTKTCIRYCRIGNTEYLPGIEYYIDINPVDGLFRIYDIWGCKIASFQFIYTNFM